MRKETKMYIMGAMCTVFFFIEIGVGFAFQSTALVADSFHMLSDLAALIVGMIALRLAAKTGDIPGYTYGFQRAEILGAFTNGIILLSLTFTIFLDALQRFFDPVHVQNPWIVLIVGILGFLMNLIGMFMFMGGSPDDHDDDDSDDEDHDLKHKDNVRLEDGEAPKKKKKAHGHGHGGHGGHGHSHGGDGGDLNLRGIFLHAMGDAIGNLGVIGSTLVIIFADGEWKFYMDPVASVIIGGIIVHSAMPLVKESTALLMQGVPDEVDIVDMRQDLLGIKDVVDIKKLHIWGLSEEKTVASIHLIVRQPAKVKDGDKPMLSVMDLQRYTKQVEDLLDDEFGIEDVTVAVTMEEEGDALRRLAKMSPDDIKNIVLPFLFSVLQPVERRQSLRTFHSMVAGMYPDEWERVKMWVRDSLPEEDYEKLIERMPHLAN